ncbi:solute carrier family 23 protein [Halalkalibacter sp. APA_J-10(15)]|uniref:solute carrier family 23 protein n=1 Tax=Halalkalibacter sp. APA_J-10(15) TaxID=2933805 RepID=UPI001FF42DC1|nr:solute carrier family 23 protein [Halalkalibacter sp. APA_J-10(15)]MCK0470687.1 NCS2 family nucleobase:cation symporter [Halalkalibacter sp. APA_J-10(15)]
MASNHEIGIQEKPRLDKWVVLSIQHLFAMFGATILVPFLVDLSPSVALLSSGLGTIAYLLITRGQVPAYLGSSFAFIAPIISAMAIGGPEGAMVGSFFAGIVYGIVALVIKTIGVKWIMNILPPIVVGPVIMVIGLGLAGVAVDMAMNEQGTGEYNGTFLFVALVSLGITVLASIFFKGFFSLVPILFGIVGGYITSLIVGIVDFTPVKEADFISAPEVIVPFVTYTPSLSWTILFIMVPIAVVTISEHIGDQMVLSKVVGRNFIKKPGLHRSLLGDGVATIIASLIGGPPNTTYGENIGVLAITRVFSVFVIAGAAVIAIFLSFIGTFAAFIESIPTAVMGGVSILLFGVIASSGLRMLIDNKINIGEKRNLIISSIILVVGIGGAVIQVNEHIEIPGMALAAIIGIILHQVLPNKEVSYGKKSMFETDE